MRDNLEDFITKNKHNFERVEPLPIDAMWHRIEGQLEPRVRSMRKPIWKKLAAAVISLAIMIPLGLEMASPMEEPMDNDPIILSVAEVYPPWQPEENKYMHLIAEKKKEIGFDTLASNAHPDLSEQLRHIDKDFAQSIEDLQRYGEKEAILKVLVRYHERQLNILEKLAREAEKEKHNAKPYEERIY